MMSYLRQFNISESLRSHQNEFLKLALIWIFISSFSVLEFKAYGTSINITKDTSLNSWAYSLLALFGAFYCLRFAKEYFAFARSAAWKNVPDAGETSSPVAAQAAAKNIATGSSTPSEIMDDVARARNINAFNTFTRNDVAYSIFSFLLLIFDLIAPASMAAFCAVQALM